MWWLVLIVFAFLIPEILSTVLDSRLGRAVAARLEERSRGPGDGATGERIRYLEGEVDRLSDEVRRLSEESDFLQRLLTERSTASEARLPRGDRAD